MPAPGVGAVCGSCPMGYTGGAQKCYGQLIMIFNACMHVIDYCTCIFYMFHADINECLLNETLCGQLCNNIDGSYFCSCQEGYQLIEGTVECEGT